MMNREPRRWEQWSWRRRRRLYGRKINNRACHPSEQIISGEMQCPLMSWFRFSRDTHNLILIFEFAEDARVMASHSRQFGDHIFSIFYSRIHQIPIIFNWPHTVCILLCILSRIGYKNTNKSSSIVVSYVKSFIALCATVCAIPRYITY